MVDDGMPLLGICVGLQWLFEGSDEAPGVDRASACSREPASLVYRKSASPSPSR